MSWTEREIQYGYCSMDLNANANNTHFHKKGCALGLILRVRVFGTRKWPIVGLENSVWRRQ